VTAQLALGDPAGGILKTASEENCESDRNDNARSSVFKDLIYGNTITQVRHARECRCSW